ncbi:Bacterial regulatory protein, tetR family [compost metagenome]
MKERIYHAAVIQMMYRGLKFSIRDVASQLGISTKTIYAHYESKDQIIAYMVDRSIQEMIENEQSIMSNESLSFKQKLRLALVNIPQGTALSDVRILRDLQKLYPEQWKKVDEHLNHGWDYIRRLIQEGMASEALRPFDVELFIRVYVGAMYHLMDNQLPGQTALLLDKALSEMVDLLLNGIFNDGKGGQ